jgi:sugar O-acyltransferase (sialic acid O-acetyltransferase NeuD family)
MGRSERQKLIILGAGLFAEEIADYILRKKEYELIAFVEGMDRDKCQQKVLGLPIIWIDDVGILKKTCKAVCAVGSTKRKFFIEQALNSGIKFITLVHPGAYVSGTVMLCEGVTVGPGTVIAASTKVGSHVIINRGCLIGHHVAIGHYVTISPGVNIDGKSRIGDLSYIGMGAVILDGISIGRQSFVGAGAIVTKDVPECVQVIGVPARISKEIRE